MNGAAPRSKAWERIGFGLAALAAVRAVLAFATAGITEQCLAGLATAATFGCVGGVLRHSRKVAEFERDYPGWRRASC